MGLGVVAVTDVLALQLDADTLLGILGDQFPLVHRAIGGATRRLLALVRRLPGPGSESSRLLGPRPTGRLIVYGLGGNDDIQAAGGITLPLWLYGGEGSDRLKGGGANNVLIGGAGDDLLVGGGDRDILIGTVVATSTHNPRPPATPAAKNHRCFSRPVLPIAASTSSTLHNTLASARP